MKIFVFGNPDLAGDNIALRILPKLQKKFPLIQFIHKDPLENWTLDNGEPSGRRFNDRQICDQKFENKKIINSKTCRTSDDRRIYDKIILCYNGLKRDRSEKRRVNWHLN